MGIEMKNTACFCKKKVVFFLTKIEVVLSCEALI
jgi:hypothetical protein